MDRYLSQLASAPKLWIMQSNGGVIRSTEARRHAVRTLLSGPAGGVTGAIETARLSGFDKVLAFDMGGTSTDVSLSEGSARQTAEAYLDGIPVRVPMLDIQTVGAGGGSIARVDEGGLLRVGPESAGALPGPACYGLGDAATVTDAHVVLGRIRPDEFLGGSMRIYADRAAAAVDKIAKRLKLSRRAAAEGIIRVANANMERAIRSVSVERGYDPRDFALIAFGGCGGLHACEIADDLGIATVVVPEHAGVLSALGMLMADRVRDYTAGVIGREADFRDLEKQARMDMPKAALARYFDMRYVGQSYELTISEGASFHAAHHKMYGYSDELRSTEVVAIRLRAIEKTPKLKLQGSGKQKPVTGPALLADYGATIWIPAGWRCRADRSGNRVITK
jgi:N-methylhydantoinase A/oxoprolinase/acetone carboxylase beta subunit